MDNQRSSWKGFLSGDAVHRCAKEVRNCNYYNLRVFSILGIITLSFSIIFGQLMREIITFNMEFFILWAYFILMAVVVHLSRDRIKHITAAFYLWMIPVMIMGIVMGSFGDPHQPSITIMVFLCVLPMFILDKPWRIVLFILLTSVVYTLCCFLAKTTELFIADMIDLVLFTVLGIGVNCLILRDRIHNVEYAMHMKAAAETDGLTTISNRSAGEEKIRTLMQQGKGGMFILIDVDDFKNINDHYGHSVGDTVLRTAASCLRRNCRKSDIVIRFGGDEFAIYAQGISEDALAQSYINRIMQGFRVISFPEISDYEFSASLGISFFNSSCEKSFERLYQESDMALYQAKREGKGRYIFFNGSLEEGEN